MGAPVIPLQSRRLSGSRFVSDRDPRWACHNTIELVSASFDSDYAAIGSSAYPGDVAGTGVVVPAAPTADEHGRYLFRLCGICIPNGASIVVRGVRLAVRLVAPVPQDGAPNFPLYFDQVSPFWHFVDGNVSFHLKQHSNVFARVFDPAQLPGTSPTFKGLDTARLYTLGAAVPVNGTPPGVDVEGLGTIRDPGRFPWTNTDWEIAVPVGGPGLVVLYASVFQTNPATRRAIPNVANPAALLPEDQFILATKQSTSEIARYSHVAGAVTVEMFPCCRAPGEH